MSTSVSWNSTTYSIPAAGETNWSNLSLFLIALAQNAQTTNRQIASARIQLTTPNTLAASTDYAVFSNLTSPGAVAFTLPAGVTGQTFVIGDGKGDAGTNNITISTTGGQTINGASTLVINVPYGVAILQFNGTQWMVVGGAVSGGGGGSAFPVRTALISPVTLTSADFCVMTNLTAPGAVAVALPAGIDGKIFAILDAKGDAATNNITITPNSGNINGAATYVISRNKGGILIQYNTTETQWKILAEYSDAQAHINASTSVHGVSGSVVGTSDSQALTAKDYQGGTASDTSRVTLPKNTAANLTGLTRKQATLVYDTTNNVVKYDDGTNLNTISTNATATSAAQGIVTSFAPIILTTIKSVSSANYVVLDNDGYDVILVSTANSNRTITLPTAADNAGRKLSIKKTDTGTGSVIIDGEGVETVEGDATQTIFKQFGSAILTCDGSAWYLIEQIMEFGTYTPSAPTPVTNIAALVAQPFHFSRIGKVVHCTGRIDVDPTTGSNTASNFEFDIPIASDFSADTDLAGVGNGNSAAGSTSFQGSNMQASVANNTAVVLFNANDNANRTHNFSFSYVIK